MMSNNILVVDDEQEIADLVELYLKNDGYRVFKFYNASDALCCVEKEQLDLAVLDVMLPDMSGFTLCQKIRENHVFPIIMLTAKVEDMDKIMGLTLGADDYMTKPFNPLEPVSYTHLLISPFMAAAWFLKSARLFFSSLMLFSVSATFSFVVIPKESCTLAALRESSKLALEDSN